MASRFYFPYSNLSSLQQPGAGIKLLSDIGRYLYNFNYKAAFMNFYPYIIK